MPTRPEPGDTARTRVAYLAGTGRSGSTIIAQMLEQSSGGFHAGELRYIWDRGVVENHLCECGRTFAECEFWTEVMGRAYGSEVATVAARVRALAPHVDRIRHTPRRFVGGRTFTEHLREYADLVTPLYESISAVSGRQTVVDSSKDPSYLYVLSGIDALDLRFVHLVRDPRAVAYSWTRKVRRPEIHWEVQYMKTVSPTRSARNWLIYNTAIDVLAARSDHATRMSYETFAEDPEAMIAQACAAAGLPLGTDARGPAGHSLSGNPVRFASSPVKVKADVEWLRALPSSDVRAVTLITLPLLRRYGYPVRVAGAG